MRKLLVIVLAVVTMAASQGPDDTTAYVCPMHPDQTSAAPGKCLKCGMALVLASPYDTRDYQLTIETVPPVVTPGQPFTIRLAVFHPGTRKPVKDFEVVHEKGFHLFVVSRDMDVFQHIHPEQRGEGVWEVSATVPKPGMYLIVSDFLPARGSSQFIARPLVTAGASLNFDRSSLAGSDEEGTSRTVDGITATISYQPSRFWAEVASDVTFNLKESATGKPIADLQPYLGSLGHMFVMSEDTLDYVHAHPALDDPTNPRARELTFSLFMPRPGRYRAWTQIQRGGKVSTFPFTFNVSDPAR